MLNVKLVLSAFTSMNQNLYWSLTCEMADSVPMCHTQLRVLVNAGLQGGIPWLRNSCKSKSQALHGLAPKCKLINMHELINKSRNDFVTLLPCENGANVNNKG